MYLLFQDVINHLLFHAINESNDNHANSANVMNFLSDMFPNNSINNIISISNYIPVDNIPFVQREQYIPENTNGIVLF